MVNADRWAAAVRGETSRCKTTTRTTPGPADGEPPAGPGKRFASNLTFSLVRGDMIYVADNAAEIGGRDRNEEHLNVKVVVWRPGGAGLGERMSERRVVKKARMTGGCGRRRNRK